MPTEPPYYDDLDGTLHQALGWLGRGIADRRSPFHTPSLATIRADGGPAVRTVILRGFDRSQRHLRIHTDTRSTKRGEIDRDPRVALHFYDPGHKIQLRVDGQATVHVGDEIARRAWDASQPMSRECYRVTPGPGTPLADPHGAYIDREPTDPLAGFENFAAVLITFDRLEWLYLAAAGHRRAVFRWEGEGGRLSATWLAP
jgi:hypothetical protein